MNGVHDMGGMACYGDIEPLHNDTQFHAEWERRVLAITLAMGATGQWNLDESRFSRESLPPASYLSIGYYRIWLTALENLLISHGLVTRDELLNGKAFSPSKVVKRILKDDQVNAVLRRGAPVDRPSETQAKFSVGDTVCVANLHPQGHTRLPGYIRGHIGIVHKVHGCHVFADSHAKGAGEDPQWLYNVRFTSQELWSSDTSFGESTPHTSNTDSKNTHAYIHVDCWEPYLYSPDQ